MPKSAVRRDIRRYHAGTLALSNRQIERRLFGAVPPPAPQDGGLAQLMRYKTLEDPPRYDVIRAALRLLPRSDMRLLDIGSGSGRLLLYAALLGAPRVTGIEIVARRVALSRAAAAVHCAPGVVKIVEGDALERPWPRTPALIAMNPFYPEQYRRFRERVLDLPRRPLIVTVSTLLDRMATDRHFRLRRETELGWVKLGAFEARD